MATALERIPGDDESFWVFKGKDPSIDNYFLVGSPVPVLMIISAYLLMVVVGPRIMKNRPPLQLETTLMVYNILQILASGIIFIGILTYSELYQDGLLYIGCRFTKSSKEPKLIFGTWIYFLTKITELLDTVFFVLRKKNNQITVLHVFHHASMVLYMWSYLKYAAAGDGAMLALLNCFIHITMYTYYLLSGLGPKYQKYLWWKKYVTELQLVQFIIMLVYLTWTYFSPKCDFSPLFTGFITTMVSIYLTLFLNFYINSYKCRANKSKVN